MCILTSPEKVWKNGFGEWYLNWLYNSCSHTMDCDWKRIMQNEQIVQGLTSWNWKPGRRLPKDRRSECNMNVSSCLLQNTQLLSFSLSISPYLAKPRRPAQLLLQETRRERNTSVQARSVTCQGETRGKGPVEMPSLLTLTVHFLPRQLKTTSFSLVEISEEGLLMESGFDISLPIPKWL